jgi:hypothetical protein
LHSIEQVVCAVDRYLHAPLKPRDEPLHEDAHE